MSVSLLPGDTQEAQGMRVALQLSQCLSLKTRVCRHTRYICIRTAEVAVNVNLLGLQRSISAQSFSHLTRCASDDLSDKCLLVLCVHCI